MQQKPTEMIVRNLNFILFILFIYFLHYVFTESSDIPSVTAPSLKFIKLSNPKIKREVVNLEVFDDIKKVKEEDNSDVDDVIFVCGNERDIVCSCDIDRKRMECDDDKLKTANLKTVFENFVIEQVELSRSNNLTIEKGKTFPENKETIKFIHFHNIKMIKLETGVFDTFTNLESLWFWGTPVSNIDENLLTEKLGKVLLYLELYNGNLNKINPMIFKNLVNLDKLKLQSNEQKNGKINEKFPEGLQNLKHLDLISCNLSSLNHDTFENLRNLDSLFLSSNKFTSIPSAIKYISNLEALMFSNNSIESIETNEFKSNGKLEHILLDNTMGYKTFIPFLSFFFLFFSFFDIIVQIYPNKLNLVSKNV